MKAIFFAQNGRVSKDYKSLSGELGVIVSHDGLNWTGDLSTLLVPKVALIANLSRYLAHPVRVDSTPKEAK